MISQPERDDLRPAGEYAGQHDGRLEASVPPFVKNEHFSLPGAIPAMQRAASTCLAVTYRVDV